MRSNLYTSSRSPQKISVRQLGGNMQYHSTVEPTYYPIEEQRTFQMPPNHIQSETSNSEPFLKFSGMELRDTRQRRRKIFQRKVLRGTVVSPQKNKYRTAVSPSYGQKSENNNDIYDSSPQVYSYESRNNSNSYENFVTMKEIQNPNNSSRQNTQKNSQFRQMQSNATSSLKPKQSNPNVGNDSAHEHEKNRNHLQIKYQSNEKLPSFARASDSNLDPHKNSYIQQQTLALLSGIPEQVRKIKTQIFSQKQQITQLHQKINRKQQKNHQRQRQLLKTLIGKQDQLTRKQSQLNQSLQKIGKVQSQSNHRYEQLLKYELQLQRAKRIQQLTNQNEKLYQQLLRNQTKDTVDMTRLNPAVNNTGPINQYFKDEDNWKQISALENKMHFQCFENSNDYDNNNTIRELLSPLEIAPDYGL